MKTTALRLVASNPAPIVRGSLRPFRLWDTKEKRWLPHRCFGFRLNAHRAAMWEATLAKIGVTIEVVNAETGKLLGQYTRGVKGVTIWWAPREQMSRKALAGPGK